MDDASLVKMWPLFKGEEEIDIYIENTEKPCVSFDMAVKLREHKRERQREFERNKEEELRKLREAEEIERELSS